jgi:translation initiation factor IF-2
MAASEVTLESRELVGERESDSGLQAAAHARERAVFVAEDGRRARALRGVARVAAGLMLLWIVALVAGAMGAGRLPVVPFPAVGSPADSAREGGPRPGVADRRAGDAVRRPSPARTPPPVAARQLTAGRASGISHGEHRRPSAPVATRSATRQASRDTRREEEVRGTRAGGAPQPGGAGGGPEPGGGGGGPEQPAPGSRSPAGATGPAEMGPPAGTTPAETGPPSSQNVPGNAGSAPGSPFGQPPAAERPGPPAAGRSDKPSPAGPPGGS